MSVERINELNIAVGIAFGKKMESVFGTDQERPFMTASLDRGQSVVERLCKLVEEGITFDIWREYFLDVNSGIGAVEFFDEEERAQLAAYCDELKTLDLQEYYDTIVVPYLNPELLKQDIESMKGQRALMEEIWNEEAEEACNPDPVIA